MKVLKFLFTLQHPPNVSLQLQVLAMGFSWPLYFCQKMSRVVYWQPVSRRTLLIDRHRAPSVARDSICFGVYVDGVCAAGCDRPEVLSAMMAVKATLDAAGLQCLEVEAATSKQVS